MAAISELSMVERSVRRSCREAVVALVVFGIFLNLLMLTVPLYMLQIYDRVLASESFPTLWALTAIGVFALGIAAALDICRGQFVNRIALGLEGVFGPNVVRSALVLGLQNPTVDGPSCVRDLEKIRNVFVSGALSYLFDVPWFPIFLGLIFLFHPVLGLVASGGAAILIGLAILNEYASRTAMTTAMQRQEELARFSEGMFRCSETVWAMGQLPALLSRWRSIQEAGAIALVGALQRGGTIRSWSRTARQAVQLAMLCAGAGLAIDGDISAGVMVVASIMMGRALAPIEQTIGNWRTLQSGYAAWKRLRKIVTAAPETSETPAFSISDAAIEIRNCNYVPPGLRLPIVRNVNLEIESGEVFALIGPSGSGKTTLAKLMAGILLPTSGSVSIGGHSAAKLAASQAAATVGYVPQDFDFIPGSIAANISGFAEDTVSDRIVDAAQKAGLHDHIQEMSNGYRTQISATSNPFSRGQAQRLALARALYADPALVIMDEPSASLDQAGEDYVLESIEMLKSVGKSVVIIAHRPSILMHADRVAVVRNGVIEAAGSYAEILPKVAGGGTITKKANSPSTIAPSKAASLLGEAQI